MNDWLFTPSARGIRTTARYRIQKELDGAWVEMSRFPGELDEAINHAESAFGGRLRILEGDTPVWNND